MKDQNATKISKEAQVIKEDGSIDLNVRSISDEEYHLHQELRYKRGAWFEEVRTAYLRKMAALGKIHPSLMDRIETGHVMPKLEIKERAEAAYMGTLGTLKERFKKLMNDLFKPNHAEIVAEFMKKAKE